jgi:hypothetical protein
MLIKKYDMRSTAAVQKVAGYYKHVFLFLFLLSKLVKYNLSKPSFNIYPALIKTIQSNGILW